MNSYESKNNRLNNLNKLYFIHILIYFIPNCVVIRIFVLFLFLFYIRGRECFSISQDSKKIDYVFLSLFSYYVQGEKYLQYNRHKRLLVVFVQYVRYIHISICCQTSSVYLNPIR